MVSLINSFKLQFTEVSHTIEQPFVLYFSGFSGIIKDEEIKKSGRNCLILVNEIEKNSIYDVVMKKTIFINNTPLIYTAGYDVKIKPQSQVILIDLSFFEKLGVPSFKSGLITHIHSRLIRLLLESICSSVKPTYELLALVNLIGVDHYKTNLNDNLNKIKDKIEECYSCEEFNLDMLCKKTHMSRRKIQYILADSNTSFLEILNNLRIDKLIYFMQKEPKTSIGVLIYRVGFKHQSTANRLFKKYKNVSIREFKKSI
ncbi:hypothetical protein VF_A0876 [Aliivibrio fischeri ES114]|uniref:HTH araC/xylS-type domain-containing protein n=1 Tax=Aliivibrio fischeri (strain ATCC 700601 / ES114) TaxID=312309 RepID=Q5DZ50_ALIF1|nr:helix-turn-helix domain-containing protein [Aliivibrio fischeri]AAW87946.1 hypothetical protein VF_A0876 [Aliivibrio fischeri ES114]KLU80430.1 hypothetical protein AB192_00970 [Aliivibrio fischeri]